MELTILPTDTRFHTSPDCGDKDCICSRCLKRITEEQAPAIRVWPLKEGSNEQDGSEYRFHIECLS